MDGNRSPVTRTQDGTCKLAIAATLFEDFSKSIFLVSDEISCDKRFKNRGCTCPFILPLFVPVVDIEGSDVVLKRFNDSPELLFVLGFNKLISSPSSY